MASSRRLLMLLQPLQRLHAARSCASSARCYSAQPERSTENIPAGHHSSDLSSSACNIGLNRRRDLTLRQDLRLFKEDTPVPLADVFKNKKVMLVGFPGGSVCTEKHVPSYKTALDTLAKKGVDKVVCVSVNQPGPLRQWAIQNNFTHEKLEFLADNSGGFVRLLGLELEAPDSTAGPKCQRFAGIVEDGILLKLQVETNPAELKVSDASHMLKLWEEIYPST